MVKKKHSQKDAGASSAALAEIAKSRRRFRGGIALKFVLPSSIVLTLMLALLGTVVYRRAAGSLEESIEKAGLFAVTSAAAPDWGTPANRARLKGMLTERVEDVVIYENKGGREIYVESSTGRSEIPVSNTTLSPPKTIGDIEIKRGRIKNTAGEWVTYRSFKKPIANPNPTSSNPSSVLGSVEVFLSEEAIENDLESMLVTTIVIGFLALAIGIAVAFVTAGRVTRPLNDLISDVEIVRKGDFSHRTRVRSGDEVGLLAETFDSMTQEIASGVEMKADLETRRHQEQIAQEIQEKLVPSRLPEIAALAVETVFEPATDISSDLYDVVKIDDRNSGFLVLTASGEGVPAAIVLAMARSAFRAVAVNMKSPADVLKRVNALIAPDLRRGMYVTATYVVYDSTTSKAAVAAAGQKLPLFRFIRATKAIERVHPNGIAIGLDKGPVFDRSIEETVIDVAQDDVLVFGTNGIVDLEFEDGQPLGEQRFQKALGQILATSPKNSVAAVKEKVFAHLSETPRVANVTLFGLRRT